MYVTHKKNCIKSCSFSFRLSPAPEKNAKFMWTFKLVHMQPEKRTYYFAAYSEREMNVGVFVSVFSLTMLPRADCDNVT